MVVQGRYDDDVYYEVRLATLDDAEALDELMERAVRQLMSRDYSPAQVNLALRYSMGVDRQLIEDGTYYLIEQRGQVLAAGGWSFRCTLCHSDGATIVRSNPKAASIRGFYVDPDRARQGLGRILLNTAERAAAEKGYQALELVATLTGVPLYLACGFHLVETVDATFPDGTRFPCMRMAKLIPRQMPVEAAHGAWVMA